MQMWRRIAQFRCRGETCHELCGSLRTCPKAVVPASELVSTESYFSLAPLVAGILIAALATVWRRGVQLSEELEGVL